MIKLDSEMMFIKALVALTTILYVSAIPLPEGFTYASRLGNKLLYGNLGRGKTFADAQKYCETHLPGSRILRIESELEYKFVKEIGDGIWLDTSSRIKRYPNFNSWSNEEWEPRSPSACDMVGPEMDWPDEDPNDYLCGYAYTWQPDRWIKCRCEATHSFICEVKTTFPNLFANHKEGLDIIGRRNGKVYYSNFGHRHPWITNGCASRGLRTLKIESAEENEFIKSFGQDFWLQVYSTQWPDKSPLNYSNFETPPPPRFECHLFRASDGLWVRRVCNERNAYACESDDA